MTSPQRFYTHRRRNEKNKMTNMEILSTEYIWSHCKSATFLVDFLKSYRGNIYNEDSFDSLCSHLPHKTFLRLYRSVFSTADRLRIKQVLRKKFDVVLDNNDNAQTILRDLWRAVPFRQQFIVLTEKILQAMQQKVAEAVPTDEASRWQELVDTMQLSQLEADVLWITRAYGPLDHLVVCSENSRHSNEDDSKIKFIAHCLKCSANQIRDVVREDGKLRRYNFIDDDIDFVYRLENFLNGLSLEPLNSNFFRKAQAPALPWDFFGELASEHGPMLKSLLSCGRPVNILFYGTPGTGKSSFAHTLSAELGLNCCLIAQNSSGERRSDSSRDFRFGALQICDQQIAGTNSLIVVDEADEMLSSGVDIFGFNSGGAKGHLNSVLDNLQTPCIWIANTPADALDESSRRRFDYSIEFKPLDSRQRLKIWQNSVRAMQLENYFTEAMLEEFALTYQVSAGGIALTLKNIAMIKPDSTQAPQMVKQLLSVHCKLMNQERITQEKMLPARDYSLQGLNIKGDIPLDAIVAAVRKFQLSDAALSPDRPRMNLLLSGPPGTGKSEYVKYLANTLNTKVIVRMGSDLLSKWVGGTEQNIKAAFEQAEQEKAILFLDEIDGLVQSRDRAGHSWEVTQVNELLYQMENFDGIMIGATNFLANLDPAIMRRFTFKLGFDYLDDPGKKIFFERMFNTVLSNDELLRLNNIGQLTPGDFRTVRQSLYYLDDNSNAHRLSALEQESYSKKQGRKSTASIGF